MDPSIVKTRQIGASILACLGGFIVGTIIGWSSPVESFLKCSDATNSTTIITDCLDANSFGWVASIMAVGAAASNLYVPFLVNIIGRRSTILALCGPIFLSWIGVVLAKKKLIMLLAARFSLGLFGCAFCAVVPMYVSEITSPQLRGTMGCCFQLLLVLGITFCWALGFAGRMDVINYVCMVWPIIFAMAMVALPETPVFLIMREKNERAKKSLQFLRGASYDTNDEMNDIKAEVSAASEKRKVGVLKKFKLKSTVKALAMCSILHVVQQLSGINAIIFYMADVLKSSGIDWNPNVAGLIAGLVQFFAVIPSVMLVDKMGRKLLFTISLGIMTACLLLEAVYFKFIMKPDIEQGTAIIAVIGIYMYLVGFSLGTGPLPWAMNAEFFSSDVREVTGAFCAFLNWMLAFSVGVGFKPLNNMIGTAFCYLIFACVSAGGAVLIWLFVLETKNKTLTQIQKELSGSRAGTRREPEPVSEE